MDPKTRSDLALARFFGTVVIAVTFSLFAEPMLRIALFRALLFASCVLNGMLALLSRERPWDPVSLTRWDEALGCWALFQLAGFM